MRTRILIWTMLAVLVGSDCGEGRLLAAAAPPKPKRGPGVFFVAPDGKDTGQTKSDGPFATLTRARDAARKLKQEQGGAFKQPVTIYIRGGSYFLQEPFVLQPEDSGTEDNPLVFAAYPGEKPIISGGRRITGWQPVIVDGKKLWAADIPEAHNGKWYFRELWVNGERRVRARHPNKGYFKIESLPDKTAGWSDGKKRFQFREGDLKAWPTVTNAEVVAMSYWVESRLPVTSVDEGQHIVNFSKRSVAEFQATNSYYLEHAFEVLDAPGEWYLDAASGRLFYAPMPSEQPDQIEAVAPVLAQVVRIEGQPQSGQFVEYVEFRGLTFAHTEWSLAKPGDTNAPSGWLGSTCEIGGFTQAAVGLPGAVWGEGVRRCAFERCAFTQLGNYALELARGAQSNRVSICEFSDLGGGGVKIGEQVIRTNSNEMAHDNDINDCRIHDGGKMFHSAVGVWIGQSPNNRIVHNLIHDFFYTGISVGWTWGYGPALASNNIIDLNIIHHIGVKSDGDGPILNDLGGIYTLGRQPGTRITRNLWHDIAAARYGGWGIYLDEGSSGILVENNIVYRTTHGGFHLHYGETNIVRNNIFAYARDQQIQRTRKEAHVNFSFTRNIVLFDQGVLFDNNWKSDNFIMESNLYWDARPAAKTNQMTFAGGSFEEWRKRGHDTNSLIAVPLFAAPKSGIFQFKKESASAKKEKKAGKGKDGKKSPAADAEKKSLASDSDKDSAEEVEKESAAPEIGFRPIDLSRVGPRHY